MTRSARITSLLSACLLLDSHFMGPSIDRAYHNLGSTSGQVLYTAIALAPTRQTRPSLLLLSGPLMPGDGPGQRRVPTPSIMLMGAGWIFIEAAPQGITTWRSLDDIGDAAAKWGSFFLFIALVGDKHACHVAQGWQNLPLHLLYLPSHDAPKPVL